MLYKLSGARDGAPTEAAAGLGRFSPGHPKMNSNRLHLQFLRELHHWHHINLAASAVAF
jgi:hypothetical protein